MSTTFGVKIKGETFAIAHRKGLGNGEVGVFFYDVIYEHLIPGDTLVYGMDNSNQGIKNIDDLRKLTENYKDETFRKTF